MIDRAHSHMEQTKQKRYQQQPERLKDRTRTYGWQDWGPLEKTIKENIHGTKQANQKYKTS